MHGDNNATDPDSSVGDPSTGNNDSSADTGFDVDAALDQAGFDPADLGGGNSVVDLISSIESSAVTL